MALRHATERWERAFGPSVVAASRVLAAARHAPGDWRTVLEELGLVEQVIKQAVTELLQYNAGHVLSLSPLALALLDLLPDVVWNRKQLTKTACLWLGVTPRFDLVYDRPVAGLQSQPEKAA